MSTTADTVQQKIKRTLLHRFDVPSGDYETVVELTEAGANGVVRRHSHPGTEAGYVLQGDATFEFDEGPAKTFKAGQSFQVPPGRVHAVRAGAAGLKAVLVWTVEKGKTFRSPAD